MKALFVATVLAVVILPSALVMARGKTLDPTNVPNILIYNPNGDGL